MELHQRQHQALVNPPAPPHTGNNNQPQNFLPSSDHYKEWFRIVTKSSRQWESVIRFIINLGTYSVDTATLVFTLFTGLHLSDDRDESIAAIGFYIVTCGVGVFVSHYNQKGMRKQMTSAILERFGKFVMNVLFILKPIRYVHLFILRNRVRRIVNEEVGKEVITERSLKSLAKLNSEELEDKRVDMYECFIQGIPMSLLQSYFLFQSYQRFQLCNFQDVARLGAILMPVIHTAKSAATYESAKEEFEQTLHFLAYYKSKNEHPMVIYKTDMLSLRGLLNTATHFFTILARIYTATYFMVVHPLASFFYLVIVYLVNLLLIYLFPQHLLDNHQNPPHGANTLPSYLVDRYINIFANVGTRFSKFSDTKFLWLFRVPLVLLQVFHFFVPLGLFYLVSYIFGVSTGVEQLVLDSSPSPLPTAIPHKHSILFTKIGDALFSSYKSFDDRFQTFNELFKFVHVLWLVFYAQVLCTWVYAFSDLMTRRRGPDKYFVKTYPILTGYSFYAVLLSRIQSTSVQSIRQFMVLTCMKEPEFYRSIRHLCILRKSELGNDEVEKITRVLVSRLGIGDSQVEREINVCIGKGHRFSTEFLQIRETLYKSTSDEQQRMVDMKLFLGFFAAFDRKLVQMSSDRIERIFKIIGWEVERQEFEWEGIHGLHYS